MLPRSMRPVTRPSRASTFTYLDATRVGDTLTCRYRSDDHQFTETATFDDGLRDDAAVDALAGLYFLLAGLSYYKTGAAHRIEAPDADLTDADVALLGGAIHDGLGEFALRNELDLTGVELPVPTGRSRASASESRHGPLIAFGGGIDSIVTVLTNEDPDPALFVVAPPTGPFEAIERPARRTALPVLRCTRSIDPSLRVGEPTFFNGHVPVTAILSSLALVAAASGRRAEVRMSNERSASSPTIVVGGRAVNHQWSKSLACEQLLCEAVAARVEGGPAYRSELRDRSELWIAREFAAHPEYLGAFMSCNRAFRQAPQDRAKDWCGSCDKCLFTDLVLAPFVDRARLEQVFGGSEPLGDPSRTEDLAVLVGLGGTARPFECVGDVDECRAALVATAARPDRADQRHLGALAARCTDAPALDELLDSRPDAARDLL